MVLAQRRFSKLLSLFLRARARVAAGLRGRSGPIRRLAADYPRRRLADEAHGRHGGQPRRALDRDVGFRTGVRRRAEGQRPVDRAERRQRPAPPAHVRQGRRGQPRVQPGLAPHRVRCEARGRRRVADLRARARRRRGAARDELGHRCPLAALQPGRSHDAVRQRDVSRCADRRGQPQGRRRTQGAQVRRARVRQFPDSSLGPLARRTAPDARGAVARHRGARAGPARRHRAPPGPRLRRTARQRERCARRGVDAGRPRRRLCRNDESQRSRARGGLRVAVAGEPRWRRAAQADGGPGRLLVTEVHRRRPDAAREGAATVRAARLRCGPPRALDVAVARRRSRADGRLRRAGRGIRACAGQCPCVLPRRAPRTSAALPGGAQERRRVGGRPARCRVVRRTRGRRPGVVAGGRDGVGQRLHPARGRSRQSRQRTLGVAHVVQFRAGRRARAAAGRGILVHLEPRQAHSQLRGSSARLRSRRRSTRCSS